MRSFYLGGSPCSGKSTLLRALGARLGWRGDSLDDWLKTWMRRAAAEGKPRCAAHFRLSPDEIWMRSPQEQCEDELAIDREMLPYVKEHLLTLELPFATEGVVLLPELLQSLRVPPRQALFLVPMPDFQRWRYRLRSWVPEVLQGCTDPTAAFERWMERDILFARYVARAAEAAGYRAVWVDGSCTPTQRLEDTLKWFRLENDSEGEAGR